MSTFTDILKQATAEYERVASLRADATAKHAQLEEDRDQLIQALNQLMAACTFKAGIVEGNIIIPSQNLKDIGDAKRAATDLIDTINNRDAETTDE